MGSGCSCCGEKKNNVPDNTDIILTNRIHDQMDQANKEISESLVVSKEKPKLHAEYEKKNIKGDPPEFLTTMRQLTEDELASIDLGPFLSFDQISSLDFSLLIDGVYFAADKAFELPNGDIYKGEFDVNGLQHGRGVEIKNDGSKFIGYFNHGSIQGQGRLMDRNGVLYQGCFRITDGPNGRNLAVIDGPGQEIWPNGDRYEGEYSIGKKNGKGTWTTNECKYTGDFKNNELCGHGLMTWDSGKNYEGQWKKSKMHGKGEFAWPDGKCYEGLYKKGEKSGFGIMRWKTGKMYRGMWKKGKQHGEGVFSFYDHSREKFRSRRSEWKQGTRLKWLDPE